MVFDAIAHPVRRQLLLLLAQEDRAAGDLAAHFDESRPGVSRHLRVLREAGLVSVRIHGQSRVYRLEARPLLEVDTWLSTFRPFWVGRPGGPPDR